MTARDQRPHILQAGPLMPYLEERLNARFSVTRLTDLPERAGHLAATGHDYTAIVTSTFLGLKPEILDSCPNVRLVASFGVGTDSLPVDHATKRGVLVTNTPDVLNDDTATMAIALLLACTRNIVANDRYVRAGEWRLRGDPPLGRSLRGKQVGMVGLGRIGLEIARQLEVFGCEIAYHTRTPRPDLPYRHEADLETLARMSAALIAIVPGGPATHHLIGARILDALGPEGVFINVARGSVVDQDAMIAALRDGRLGHAGLDVYDDEPNVPDTLAALPNVVLQPHQASATRETREAMADLVLANLDRFFADRTVVTPVVPATRTS
ncbi:2-hydroxyacid dehydrogenase [Gluconacetobacter takamatsuzukensis]|uniref:2-hydroxyacid dehydrogenase n=1 Tax=Gluconacetobacter takamatsuzukensis TaxID=1286190 RepID=A0A7W4KG94_9PROT|nr:2-hydroxyacid dehydrogenase [Gluconacetobacter takamatsuzukensis]MBB2206391.1 2-hydroxyacid dehydrogenase [Gluconacetobacter takamatsuzukensis]